ncbi:MAG: assembly factor cbp4 [Bogoriella megaspora]|nr:MAG: assembly factor cbp4 [Bogoriella megaspora]
MPSEEELFSRYNPELQRRSLENRQGRQEEFDQFVTRLKQYSKSDKPIWEAQAEAEELAAKARKDKIRDEQSDLAAEVERRRQEMRASTTR